MSGRDSVGCFWWSGVLEEEGEGGRWRREKQVKEAGGAGEAGKVKGVERSKTRVGGGGTR